MATEIEAVLEQPDASNPAPGPTAEELIAEQEFAAGFKRVVKDVEPPEVKEVKAAEDVAATDAVVETPEAKVEEKEVAAAPAAVTPDLSTIVRAELEKSEHRIRSDFGRQLAALKAAGKAAAQEVTEAPTDAQVQAAAKSGGEKWKALQEEWPEWAAALDERLSTLPKHTPQTIDVEALTAQVRERIAQVNPDEIIQATVTELKHPGWKATVKTPAFKTWYDGQPADVHALGASAAAGDAIKLLDTYSEVAARAQAQQRSQTRLDNAVTPKGAATSGPKPLDDEAAFALGFNRVMKRR